MSSYLQRLRSLVGHELLVLPSVTVLPNDVGGRVLLVRHIDSGKWGTIGGLIEPDEHPTHTAIREAREETGIEVAIGNVLAVLGGPEFRVRYSNGDHVAYVSVVYDAAITSGALRPDGVEVDAVAWFDQSALQDADIGSFARACFKSLGWI